MKKTEMKQSSAARGISRQKGQLILSVAVLVLMTTPAWIPGMIAAIVFATFFCLAIWRFFPEGERCKEKTAVQRGAIVCLSLLICGAFGTNFYHTWMDSSFTQKLAQMLHIPVEWLTGGCMVVAVLLSLPAVCCILRGGIHHAFDDLHSSRAISELEQADRKNVSMKQAVWLLFVVYCVGFSAVLRTNFYYLDDNGRAAFGYKTWDYFGRYLSTGFSTLLHMGDYLVDISPLPQLVALWLLAAASVLLLYVIYDRTSFSYWELAAAVPLGLNPYFLECLSFRFDAPYMAVSVLAGILPLLYRRRQTWVYVLASMLGILGVCTSYQAATGIFPILVIALMLRMWNRGEKEKEILTFCGKSLAGYGLGLVYFKLVIMKPADAGYVSNAMPEASGLIGHTIQNLTHYYRLVLTDFKPLWLLLVLLAAAAFVFLSVFYTRRNKIAAVMLTGIALGLMLLLCFGIYPVLESTLFSPRAMYGFGVLIAIVCVVVAEGRGWLPMKLPALLLSWTFFVFSFTYGNALNLQKNYTEFRIHLVMEDLNEVQLAQPGERIQVRLSGDIGSAPVLDNMPQNYEILKRLVPGTFAGGDDLTEYQFYEYYGLLDFADYGTSEACPEDMPVWKDGLFHTIRREGNCILVELK